MTAHGWLSAHIDALACNDEITTERLLDYLFRCTHHLSPALIESIFSQEMANDGYEGEANDRN